MELIKKTFIGGLKMMLNRKTMLSLLGVLFFLLASGCRTVPTGGVTQISVIDALLAGCYDGTLTLKELSGYGDFGIGTFDRLDGEMVFVDGNFYQIKADGRVYVPAPSLTTPFASVSWFEPEKSFSVQTETDDKAFQEIIDSRLDNPNLFIAIRAQGRFSFIKTRSVPAQEKPYPPLAEVAAAQPVFTRENITGQLVGYRCPYYVRAINVPDYHLHFISDDKDFGGHVLAFTMQHGTIEIDTYHEFQMILPETGCFAEIDFGIDRGDELEQVER